MAGGTVTLSRDDIRRPPLGHYTRPAGQPSGPARSRPEGSGRVDGKRNGRGLLEPPAVLTPRV